MTTTDINRQEYTAQRGGDDVHRHFSRSVYIEFDTAMLTATLVWSDLDGYELTGEEWDIFDDERNYVVERTGFEDGPENLVAQVSAMSQSELYDLDAMTCD